MNFDLEMIVPRRGVDDLGQQAAATITFLRYGLTLGQRPGSPDGFQVEREELSHINLGDAARHLPFPHSASRWRWSVVSGERRGPFISTETEKGRRLVRVHLDGGGGRPRDLLAAAMPRTSLSTANAASSPTAMLARREMRNWRVYRFDPVRLAQPGDLRAPPRIQPDGSHLPAALNLAESGWVSLGGRLSELLGEPVEFWVERDPQRALLTLKVRRRDGAVETADALGSGALRMLALAALEGEGQSGGLICIEEPENGIHAGRIPALVRLLEGMVTNVREAEGAANPLRQVIANTHSPVVIGEALDDDLLVAGPAPSGLAFQCLTGSWRADCGLHPAQPREILFAGLTPGHRPHRIPAPARDFLAAVRTGGLNRGMSAPQKQNPGLPFYPQLPHIQPLASH